jgi:hypothetical protein
MEAAGDANAPRRRSARPSAGRKRKLDAAGLDPPTQVKKSAPLIKKSAPLVKKSAPPVKKGSLLSLAPAKTKGKGTTTTGKTAETLHHEKPPLEENSEEDCAICMDEITGPKGKLNCCSHIFCAPCILKVGLHRCSQSASCPQCLCVCVLLPSFLVPPFLHSFLARPFLPSRLASPFLHSLSFLPHLLFCSFVPSSSLPLQWAKTSNTCPLCVLRFNKVTEVRAVLASCLLLAAFSFSVFH